MCLSTVFKDTGEKDEEVMRDVIAFATAPHPPEAHDEIIQGLQQGAHDWAVHNFATGCEVGDMLLERLQFDDGVREALGHTFERWNGNGFPNHTAARPSFHRTTPSRPQTVS